MAVRDDPELNVKISAIAGALRLGDGEWPNPDDPVRAILERLYAVGSALVDAHATRNLPEVVRDQAVIQFAGYVFDSPESPAGDRYAAAFRNSGALALLGPWRVRRAGKIGA